ncbi:cob(I)alamin adenosyltransferase [Ruminiclostridium sufflavum DSM 19573]|uniref:Cob(I)alamin adenosyltransferase n=1 Tax=Ruminiclostridium sufflavum DSM 19573 TaxID=1121337 RepID=A0A318XMG8_9FIRM|nr:cob(I)yrinic acid a,c-diamide adenosyltransferase [Ruminiclostridium sufflavum]PYG89047.1 cob(I)alamin adenosyltransferase [Ruminiclostridium sufflavum DSM 19573]
MDGLVHIYTGNGKGKTTAAVGLGIRAAGSGMKVLMIQFCKGGSTCEELVIAQLKPAFELLKDKKISKFTWQMTEEEHKQMRENTLNLFNLAISSANNKDMIILDEIMAAISAGFIDEKLVFDFVKNKPSHLELVMTGRNAPEKLVELADYVSEINAVKHPMTKGIDARKGIEF